MKKNGFTIEDELLEPIITIVKRIGNEYSVELSARAIERDFQEDEETKEKFVHELDRLTKQVHIEQTGSSGYFLRK